MELARTCITSIFLALVGGTPAAAACFADYKAKQGSPLRLHYGVIQLDISPCELSNAVETTVKERIAAEGWTLLQVQSVFDDSGLESRKQDAGKFFLRF